VNLEFFEVLKIFGLREEKHVSSAHYLYPKKIAKISKILHGKLSRNEVNDMVQKRGRWKSL